MPVEESVTLMDVARAAGISKATASRALSGNGAVSSNVRQAVRDAAERLGFEVNPYAQRLSTGMARNVVGLFALTLDYMTWQSMSHLHYELASRGYEAPLYTYGYSQEDWPDYRPLLSTLSRQQPQGIICNTFKLLPKAAELLRQYQQKGGTLVCLHTPHDIPCDQILLDREASLRLAIRHLLEAGHQKIGLCGFVTRDLVKSLIPIFHQELKNYGVDPSLSCLIDTNTNTEDGVYMVTDEVRGAALAEKFRQLKNRPTALCVINDIIATTFVHQILLAGFKVPEDVSVIAIDGMPVSLYGMVKITTVAQPRYEMAAKAVEFLLQRLDGTYRGEPRKLVYTGEVVARDSVRKI